MTSVCVCMCVCMRACVCLTGGQRDVSLACLTKALLREMVNAPDGVLDLRKVVTSLHTRRRRVYDITNVLSSISLIKKESANRVMWMYV